MIDKSAFDLIGPYYRRPGPASDFSPGQICDATVYYFPPGSLSVLEFDMDAANRGESVTYTMVSVGPHTFSHRPVAGLRPLERDEAFVVLKAKRRPVVILSSPITRPNVVGLPRHDFPEVFLVAPLHSFRDNHPPEFRLRVEAWEYPMLFHLPTSGEFGLHEGFLRFDHSLIIPKGQLRFTGAALTENALLALRECFLWFLAGELDDTFADYRRHLLNALNRSLGREQKQQ